MQQLQRKNPTPIRLLGPPTVAPPRQSLSSLVAAIAKKTRGDLMKGLDLWRELIVGARIITALLCVCVWSFCVCGTTTALVRAIL